MIWTIIQLVISGIAMGFVYALIGIEYTLIYNATARASTSHSPRANGSGWGVLTQTTLRLPS